MPLIFARKNSNLTLRETKKFQKLGSLSFYLITSTGSENNTADYFDTTMGITDSAQVTISVGIYILYFHKEFLENKPIREKDWFM